MRSLENLLFCWSQRKHEHIWIIAPGLPGNSFDYGSHKKKLMQSHSWSLPKVRMVVPAEHMTSSAVTWRPLGLIEWLFSVSGGSAAVFQHLFFSVPDQSTKRTEGTFLQQSGFLLTKQDYSVGLSSLLSSLSLPLTHFAPSVLLWRQLCIYTCDIPASSWETPGSSRVWARRRTSGSPSWSRERSEWGNSRHFSQRINVNLGIWASRSTSVFQGNPHQQKQLISFFTLALFN